MDIVTHALVGGIVAFPLWTEQPLFAAGFALGSVLPDIDALSRCFGKTNFLQFHQSYTHSIFTILCVGMLSVTWLHSSLFLLLPVGISLGMLMHSLLDLTNTYGIQILAPLSRRRFAWEWVFFIDMTIIALCLVFIGIIVWQQLAFSFVPSYISAVFLMSLCIVLIMRAYTKILAKKVSPQETISLLPCAFWPWRYLGCLRSEEKCVTFEVSLLKKEVQYTQEYSILDKEYPQVVVQKEFQIMKNLSCLYHVVSAKKVQENLVVVCKDLRTRHFDTNFGKLDVALDRNGEIVSKTFYV